MTKSGRYMMGCDVLGAQAPAPPAQLSTRNTYLMTGGFVLLFAGVTFYGLRS